MANRYWVGGTGTWDAATTTNWSATSGGAGGASAPTSVDDVFFDAGSDAGGIFTVTIGTGAVCRDITAGSLDFTMTLAGSAELGIYGSLLLPATNLTRTHTGSFNFLATTIGKTITTNGVSLNGAFFNGAGGEWTLGSALTTGSSITHSQGSFITNNFNISCGSFLSNSNLTRSLTLGSSVVTTFGTLLSFVPTGLTFNAGTSTINCAAANPTFTGGNLTYYNVSFTSTSASGLNVNGDNTFNNLTFTSVGSNANRFVNFGGNQTINGTITFGTTNTAIRRMPVSSNTIGFTRTLTVAAMATLSDVDFRDITILGTASPVSGTRLGDCGGNSNITFSAPKTVYRVGTGSWSATQWALSSGGAVDVNNFPLAQDTAFFDTGTVTGAHTIEQAWNIGTLDMSALNVPITLATGTTSPTVYGNVTLDSDVTLTGTGAFAFSGASTQTITSSGKSFSQPFIINKPVGANFSIADNFTTSAGFTLTQGTVTLNDNTLTALTFSSSNTNTRAIAFGTGSINLTGNNLTVFAMNTATSFTYSGTPTLNLTYAGAVGTRTINFGSSGGALESNVLSLNVLSGSDIVIISGANSWKNVLFTGFSGIFNKIGTLNIYGDLLLNSAMFLDANTLSIYFRAAGGTQTITTNGKTLDFPFEKLNASTLQLQDALTLGSTRTLTHTGGTIDLNGNTLTAGVWSSTGTVARSINFNNGSIVCLGAWTASGSNLTTSGAGSISMTNASAKTFAGGGFTYTCGLNQGGAGNLTITGANTFGDISNSVQPSTIIFPASTITKTSALSVTGTAGNLVSLRSSVSGTRFTIEKI